MADHPDNESVRSTAPVAVFGGTFDPVHNGHLHLARQLLNAGHAGEIVFVPTGRPPHKRRGPVASGADRLAMLRLAVAAAGPGLAVSACELERPGVSYTVDTARHFAAIYGDRLRLLIGMDMFVTLHQWHRADELVRDYRFLVYRRPGWELPAPAVLTARFGAAAARLRAAVVDGPLTPLAATDVRAACRRGAAIDAMVPPNVAAYIHDHQLYGAAPVASTAVGAVTSATEPGGS